MRVEIKGNKIKAPLKGNDVWIPISPEEEIRQKYICRLVNIYGFTTKQMAQDYDYSKITDKKIKSDVLVWKNELSLKNNEKPLIFIECKSDSIIIRPEDYFKGIEISKQIGAEFFVATNSKQTKIYSKVFKISEKGQPNELINIPTNEQAQDEHTISVLLGQTNEFVREDFSKTLLRCHNIIRNNDKLSPEAAFDEISKILFIKTLYERGNKEGNIFSLDVYKKEKKQYLESFIERQDVFYQMLFAKVKKDLKDDDLFEPTEVIRIRENSFEAIIEELQTYNLSTTSDDIKGIAFEQFLGKTFRGELGQFFTPRTVVDFMVEVLDPQESEVICDPCCGSGGFLIKAFEYVRAKIENEIHLAKEKIKAEYYDKKYEKLTEKKKIELDEKVNELFTKLNAELDINNHQSRIRELSYNCIFGIDANPRMSRTAKMNMIMHGDGHGGVHHNDGLLNVNGIFENRFDIILTNPPFGSRVEKSLKITEADKYTDADRIAKYRERYGKAYDEALKQINNNIDKPLLDLYHTGSMSTLTEVLFIERCLNLLKPGGRMGIVLPEGVLNNSNLQKIRDYVEGRAKILFIVSIPQDVFIASGANVKPSLLFFKKFTEEEAIKYKTISIKATNEIVTKYKSIEQKELEKVKVIEMEYEAKNKDLKSINTLKGIKKGNVKINTAEYEKLQESVEELKKALKEAKTTYNNEIKRIQLLKESEIKAQIKTEFNYQIPIAEVEKAGISTTGAVIENELKPLVEEFKTYKEQNQLWAKYTKEINYQITDEEIDRLRIIDGIVSEPEVFYDKKRN